MGVEAVLCLETHAVRDKIDAEGFIPVDREAATEFLSSGSFWFAPRNIIEYREDFRQVIPYVLLMHGDSVAVYQRTPKGGESRLHGLYSMGFGGHVGLGDVVLNGEALDAHSTIERAVTRELSEEASHSPVVSRELVGMIYDNAEAVSRVHLGIVEIWRLSSPFATSAEPAVGECALVEVGDLAEYVERMEGWSRLCAEYLIGRFSS